MCRNLGTPKISAITFPRSILTGRADPVSVGGAADHFFDKALSSSEKILIEFPGLGHDIDIPTFDPPNELRNRLTHLTSCTKIGRSCLIEGFISGGLDNSTWNLLFEEIGDKLANHVISVVGSQEQDCKTRIREGTAEIS